MSGTNKKAPPLTEEQLSEKEVQLQEFEGKLNADREAFEKEKEDFETYKTEKEAELEKQKTDLEELEKELMTNVGAPEEVAEPEPGLEFKVDKDKFKFKDDAPKTLNLGGKKLSQAEIIKDKVLLQKIIKTNHIEKIK